MTSISAYIKTDSICEGSAVLWHHLSTGAQNVNDIDKMTWQHL